MVTIPLATVTNEKQPAGPTQENPPQESPTDSIFLNSPLDEVRTELNRLDIYSLLTKPKVARASFNSSLGAITNLKPIETINFLGV